LVLHLQTIAAMPIGGCRLVVAMMCLGLAGSAGAQTHASGFAANLEGWTFWSDVHPGETHSYSLNLDLGTGGISAPSARVSGDFDVLSTNPSHLHQFGLERRFEGSGSEVAIALRYRASSSTTLSTVTNLQLEVRDGAGRVLHLSQPAAGGVSDTGWKTLTLDPIALQGANAVVVRLFLRDLWTVDYQQTIRVDDVSVAFRGGTVAPPPGQNPTRPQPSPGVPPDPDVGNTAGLGADLDDEVKGCGHGPQGGALVAVLLILGLVAARRARRG
jgi:hypothetical protein